MIVNDMNAWWSRHYHNGSILIFLKLRRNLDIVLINCDIRNSHGIKIRCRYTGSSQLAKSLMENEMVTHFPLVPKPGLEHGTSWSELMLLIVSFTLVVVWAMYSGSRDLAERSIVRDGESEEGTKEWIEFERAWLLVEMPVMIAHAQSQASFFDCVSPHLPGL